MNRIADTGHELEVVRMRSGIPFARMSCLVHVQSHLKSLAPTARHCGGKPCSRQ